MAIRNRINKLILVLILLCTLFFALFPIHSVSATDSSASIVETTFFGNLQDDGKGCGVYTVLNMVVDILSVGVGILGVVGITIVGIQYLTAGGNEQQTIKAKRRMSEIIIGLIAYAVLYAVAQWLLPGGKLSTNVTCQTISDEQLAEIRKAEQESKTQTSKDKTSNTNTQNSSDLKLSSQIAKTYTPKKMAKLINEGKIAPSPVCTDCTWSERIAETAELLSWPKKEPESRYHYDGETYGRDYKSWSDMKGAKPNKAYRDALDALYPKHGFSSMSALGADCGHFVTVVLKYSGHDRGMQYGQAEDYFRSHNWKQVDTAKRGDVCIYRPGFHIWIYLGGGLSAEANHSGQNFGHITNRGCKSAASIWRATT